MRSFLTKTTKLLVDDVVFLSSSLSSLPRSFCALLLLSMLTLMPSSAATARTTTGCSFAVVCVSVCFYSFCLCGTRTRSASHQALFWGGEIRNVARRTFFLNLCPRWQGCAFFCFSKKKKDGAVGRCDKSSNSTFLVVITTHTVRYISLLKTHTHYIYIYTHRGCRRCL